MYNISHIYIYEDNTDESIEKSIELLIKSSNLGFEPSTEMLCLVLVKKYYILNDFNIIKKKISEYTEKCDSFISKFDTMIKKYKLYNIFHLNEVYEYRRTIDYLYDFTYNPIESKKILEIINEQENQSSEITQSFYDGFGIDI